MSKLVQLFTTHPASVGESYFQHMAASFSFGVPMAAAALAAIVHGIFPFLFTKTGSGIVSKLYGRMVLRRSRKAAE